MTNADRIRGLTDDELTIFLNRILSVSFSKFGYKIPDNAHAVLKKKLCEEYNPDADFVLEYK